MDVANRLTQLRTIKGYSINKLADIAGISQSYLRDIELKKKKPSVEVISYLCDGLDISLKDFFNSEDLSDLQTNTLLERIFRLTTYQRELLEKFLESFDKKDNYY